MAEPTTEAVPRLMDEDQKFDFAQKKSKRKYKTLVRKYRREADNENSELNLTAMMDMMTILLVFLIKSYGAAEISVAMGENLMPPTSESTLQPVESLTSVTITKKDISVAEKGVVQLTKDGKVPPEKLTSNGLITDVKSVLEKVVATAAEGASHRKAGPVNPAGDPIQMLTIVGDKDLPYETFYYVLKTAGRLQLNPDHGEKPLKYFKFLVLSNT
jgi:biopolymer transport protein ExbD